MILDLSIDLHIDIETFSSVDIKTCGAYKYLESPDFEILIVAYAYGSEAVQIVDLANGEKLPESFLSDLLDPSVRKHAHNAAFERTAFRNYGINTPIDQWFCSQVKAAYCGYPLSLGDLSSAMKLGDKAKLASGKALIKYFTSPCKPSKVNGGRVRNLPEHAPDKWEEFKKYCGQDVEAEREVNNRLAHTDIPSSDRTLYILDQEINDLGICIDPGMAASAVKIDSEYGSRIKSEVKRLTGLENPNSPAQLKSWLGEALQIAVESLAKTEIPHLIDTANILGAEAARVVLLLRSKLAKTSITKYKAMLNCLCSDGRAHGLMQFYGANRTGRWAGRLIQVQNLPQNHIDELDLARQFVKRGDLDDLNLLYDDVPSILSQLIRTAFVAKPGHTFAVADFSAIEARVIAWLAGESWRLEVFATHGKIYEASAARMFNVDVSEVTKGSPLRQRAKVAELALGYQGGVGALKTMIAALMGGRMSMTETEMESIVRKWREANPAIKKLWKDLEYSAKKAIKTKKPFSTKYLKFNYIKGSLVIGLPSGRELFYVDAHIKSKTVRKPNGETWEAESIRYWGMDQQKKQWTIQETYGGKLAENVTQAIARDLLAVSMLELRKKRFNIVMHVHDEVVAEVPQEDALSEMCEIMSRPVQWAPGLPLTAEGYHTSYYKKD